MSKPNFKNPPPHQEKDLGGRTSLTFTVILGKWLPVLLWAALLFCLSSVPGEKIPSFHFALSDKVAHCFVYGVFGALSFRAVRATTRLGRLPAILTVALLAAGYGISDEIHQMFVPERSPDVFDVMADVVGGSLGAIVAGQLPFFLPSFLAFLAFLRGRR